MSFAVLPFLFGLPFNATSLIGRCKLLLLILSLTMYAVGY
jgi:hypothetical protein